MSRPYPVPVQISTLYTESRGNVDVSTYELTNSYGETKYETAIFWDMDPNNPNDPGSAVVEITMKKPMAYINHKLWCHTQAVESKIHQVIQQIGNEK